MIYVIGQPERRWCAARDHKLKTIWSKDMNLLSVSSLLYLAWSGYSNVKYFYDIVLVHLMMKTSRDFVFLLQKSNSVSSGKYTYAGLLGYVSRPCIALSPMCYDGEILEVSPEAVTNAAQRLLLWAISSLKGVCAVRWQVKGAQFSSWLVFSQVPSSVTTFSYKKQERWWSLSLQ